MYSLLQKKPIVETDPYPHVVIHDALPWDIYEKLENDFPEKSVLATEPFDNGICYRLKSDQMLKPGVVSDSWRQFAQYHTSENFYDEWVTTNEKKKKNKFNNSEKTCFKLSEYSKEGCNYCLQSKCNVHHGEMAKNIHPLIPS